MSTTDYIMQELAVIRRNQETLMGIMAPLVTRKLSVADQAKKAGCSKTTIWRRRKAAALKLKMERMG